GTGTKINKAERCPNQPCDETCEDWPKTKSPSRAKVVKFPNISKHDRLMAISRIDEYIKGHEELRSFFDLIKKKGQTSAAEQFRRAEANLCAKWGLFFPIRPHLTIEDAKKYVMAKCDEAGNLLTSPPVHNYLLTSPPVDNSFEIDITKSTTELVKEFRQRCK